MLQLVVCLTWVTFLGLPVDDKSANQDMLKQKGYKLAGDVVAASEESEVEKLLKSLRVSYKTVLEARNRLSLAERDAETNREIIKQLANRRLQLGQLMGSQNSVAARNSIVVQLNAISDEMSMRIQADQKGEALANAREIYSTPRNAYLKSVLALREIIDKTNEKYKTAAKDTSMTALLTELAKTENKKVTLGPTKAYLQNEKEFLLYEAKIISENIPLERNGGTYHLDVILNSKAPIKMVFDTGASSISLSHEVALKVGLKPTDATPNVMVSIANGRTVKGKMMKLASVRVGKFELKNVECIVMPEELADSPLLLGGSFLNNFKYEVDAGKLRLTRLDGGGGSTSTKTAGK